MQTKILNSSIHLNTILSKLSPSNLIIIAQYLDHQTIQLILKNTPHYKTKSDNTQIHNFLNILFVKSFTVTYLHETDRSNYMTIYQFQLFKDTQNNKLKSLWLNGHQKSHQTQNKINLIKKGITKQLQSFFDVQSALETLFLSINDPMPPQLNLRKTNVGTYCNSSFQFYLIQKRFPPKNKYLEPPFSQLKDALNQLRKQQLKQQNWQDKLKQENIKEKIQYFSEYWYKINMENYEHSLINSQKCYIFVVHNTIVYLMALFDAMLQIIDLYLEVFSEDLFHEFIEFNMRFDMFRNSLLQLQTQLNFLFQNYSQIVKQIHHSSQNKSQNKDLPTMTVWRCLLSKWYLFMKKRHNSLNIMYCYLFKKMNYRQFIQNLKGKQIQLSQYAICLQNSLGFMEEDIQGSLALGIQSPLLEFTEDNQFIHQLLKQYVEYMVDISINQDSVHWCGHSDHQMHIPYQQYSHIVVSSLNEYLQKIYKICHEIDVNDILFMEIINKILNQMDKEYLKPITLKKLINQINQSWGHFTLQKQNDQAQSSCEDILVQNQSIIKSICFIQRDNRVEHFNCLEKIPSKFNYSHNIVIQSEDFNSSLKKSANTNCTDDRQLFQSDELDIFDGMNKSQSMNYEI